MPNFGIVEALKPSMCVSPLPCTHTQFSFRVKNMGSRSSFRRWFQEVGKTVGEMEKGRELIKGMQKQVTGTHPNGDLWGAV